MFAHHQLFDDADRHAEALQGWNQRYDQIGAGAYRSVVKQASVGGLQLFQETANVRVVQRGHLPPGHAVFGIPLGGMGGFVFGGARGDHDAFVVARGGEPFELHTPNHMSFVCVVVTLDVLQAVIDMAGPHAGDGLFRHGVVEAPGGACARAGLRIATLLERVLAEPLAFDGIQAQRALNGEACDALGELLTYRLPAPPDRLTYACRADIVHRVHDHVMRHPDEPVDILSLCMQLRVSRRTMQNSFQSVTQTGPLAYVRSLRLAQVRRLLLDTRRAELPVSDAAARWGFVNLGHFANAYRAQFGELPSQTVRRSGRKVR